MTSLNVPALAEFGDAVASVFSGMGPVVGRVAPDQTVCSIEDGLIPHTDYEEALSLANGEAVDLLLKLHFLRTTAQQLAATITAGDNLTASAMDAG